MILDDRADLVLDAGFDGVHVDSGDVTASDARWLLGPERIIGTFGGSESILPEFFTEPANYFAIGPVFQTRTKQTAKLPIGSRRCAASCASRQGHGAVLSAAAGITLETAQAVLDAGATWSLSPKPSFDTADPRRSSGAG